MNLTWNEPSGLELLNEGHAFPNDRRYARITSQRPRNDYSVPGVEKLPQRIDEVDPR